MKISTRFSDSIHILAFINIYQGTIPLTSNNIASSIETSPVVVRRLMSALNKAGLINTVHGAADPALQNHPKISHSMIFFLRSKGMLIYLQLMNEQIPNASLAGISKRRLMAFTSKQKQPRKLNLREPVYKMSSTLFALSKQWKMPKKKEGTNNEVYGYWCNRAPWSTCC